MMKKNRKFILFFVVGFLSIPLGIILITWNYTKKKEPKPLEPAFNLKVDTSQLELKDVDLSNYEYINFDLSKESYIKSYNTSIRNKYIFNYPKDLLSKNNGDTSISLYNNNYDLNVNVVNSNIEKYYSDVLKKKFESQKENINHEYYVTEIIKNNNIVC